MGKRMWVLVDSAGRYLDTDMLTSHAYPDDDGVSMWDSLSEAAYVWRVMMGKDRRVSCHLETVTISVPT